MSEAIDVDGDGEITKDEFIKNAMECEFVCDMLQVGIAGDDSDSDDDWYLSLSCLCPVQEIHLNL